MINDGALVVRCRFISPGFCWRGDRGDHAGGKACFPSREGEHSVDGRWKIWKLSDNFIQQLVWEFEMVNPSFT